MMRLVAPLTGALLVCALCTAFASTYHIDPTAAAEVKPDGSVEQPFTSWDQVRLETGNTYLQRRGTIAQSKELRPASSVTIGAYGEGPMPRLESLAEGNDSAIAGWKTQDFTIRDFEITAPQGVSLIKLNGAERATIQRCKMHDSHWGIRLYGGGKGHRILDTDVYNILDDGMFLQWLSELTIARCYVHHVNRNWKPPYTSQKEAGGDAIQLSHCDAWHVHHNRLDRTNSGNKFCFISCDEQTSGLFEHNHLVGPLTQGDGGSSIYFGQGGSGVIVRYNTIEAPSCGAIYHHTAGLQVYGNVIIGLPVGFTNYGVDPPTQIHSNVFLRVPEKHKGYHYEARGNLDVTPLEGPGASTLQMRFGGLKVGDPGDEASTIPEDHTGSLQLHATGLSALRIDDKLTQARAPNVRLTGTVELKSGKVTRGQVTIIEDGQTAATFILSPEGFALERLIAARIAEHSVTGPTLAGVDLTHWQSGRPLGAWIIADPDSGEVQVSVTAGPG